MGKALYRKYRSKSLAEIIGQEHITQTLDHALKQGTISHAYLFTGPRGTGKTSIARILAHEVNKLPYSEQTHLDIIEIDAASNRRIDEIRELKERVNTAPTSVKYKVYIIDEVHMLTKEAFNALLKTLEEPPDHVIFILATTEAHKVPETIISRTQRFTFKPVSAQKVIKHLKTIAKKESIKIDDEALELIAIHGEGSFRDSISLLDQVRHSADKISLTDIQQAIGLAPNKLLDQVIAGLRSGNLKDTANSLTALQSQGIQPPQVAGQLSQLLRRDILTAKPLIPLDQSLQLLNDLVEVGAAPDPSLKLELALYSAALKTTAKASSVQASATSQATPEPPMRSPPKTASEFVEILPKISSVPKRSTATAKTTSTAAPSSTSLDAQSWLTVLAAVKASHNTLYGIARMAVPSFEPGKLTLRFGFAFHQKRLNDNKNKQLLSTIIKEVIGQAVFIECLLDAGIQNEPSVPVIAPKPDTSASSIDLEAISNIFGSAEVVD